MFIYPKQKSLFSFFSFFAFLFLCSFNISGQCGVYLKHDSTQFTPHPYFYANKSDDMTGDGIPDLIGVKGANLSSAEQILIYPNSGDGTFGAPIIINAPQSNPFYWLYFEIGKVNNDSLNDLITYFPNSSSLLIYINNGNGTFTPQTLLNAQQMGRPFSIFDFNGDGFGDYFGLMNSGEFRYSLGNGDGTFSAPITLSTIGGVGRHGDFNNDGAIDFVNSRTLFINQGDNTFTQTPITLNGVIYSVQDFNGDGKSDILTVSTSNSNPKFYVLISNGTNFTETEYTATNESSPDGITTLGYFNADAFPDIMYNFRYKNKVVVFLNDGTGNFTRQEFNQRYYRFNDIRQILGDFDNDGKTDLVLVSSGHQQGFTQTANRNLGSNITLLKTVCNRQGQPRVVDYDGFDSTDFSSWNPTTGDWKYTAWNTTSYESQIVNWGLGSLGDIPTPGDFDGDGVSDRAVFRNSTGVWYIRRSSDLAWIVFQFGLTGDKPVAADYDGDGISDIAVWRPSDGNWYIWYMGTQQFSAFHWGSEGDKPVPADFDGDFKRDIAVFRPSTGVWYYYGSSNGSIGIVQWGIDLDTPAPADYDGDNKADLAVYRNSNSSVYIRRSYDSSLLAFSYGNSGDIPQPGDYNGDFVDEFALFRPTEGKWYLSNNLFAGLPFGSNNSIPTSSILRIE